MNLLIIANRDNAERIAETIESLGESQTESVNGKLLVLHEAGADQIVLQNASRQLAKRFKVAEILSVLVNARLSGAVKNATLFATFLLKAYAKSPGPWLVIDDPARPKGRNIITALHRQHRDLGGHVTGRGQVDTGSITPVGPIVIELPSKELKVLISQAGTSWRERGKFMFARSGWRTVPLDEYLFDMTAQASPASAPSVPTPAAIPPSNPPIRPEKPVVAIERPPTVAGHAEQIAETQQESEPIHITSGAAEPLPLTEISAGDIPPDIGSIKESDLDDLGRNELYNLMWGLTGEKPHPKIGESTLRTRITAIRNAGE